MSECQSLVYIFVTFVVGKLARMTRSPPAGVVKSAARWLKSKQAQYTCLPANLDSRVFCSTLLLLLLLLLPSEVCAYNTYVCMYVHGQSQSECMHSSELLCRSHNGLPCNTTITRLTCHLFAQLLFIYNYYNNCNYYNYFILRLLQCPLFPGQYLTCTTCFHKNG